MRWRSCGSIWSGCGRSDAGVGEWRVCADLRPKRSERQERAHTGPIDFVLRALAARKLLQQRKSLRRCAAEQPVIHVSRSENDMFKDQVADKATSYDRSVFRLNPATYLLPDNTSALSEEFEIQVAMSGVISPRKVTSPKLATAWRAFISGQFIEVL